MAHGGSALGRAGGKTIFVPYTLPGETVEVRLVEDRGRWATAELVRVIKPSPDRVTPPCPHFGPLTSLDSTSRETGQRPGARGEGPGDRGEGPEAEDVGGQVEGEADPPGKFRRGCGGCQWQHIAYPAQLRLKQAVVRDQFARVGKLPDVDVRPTIGMDGPWYYRNHVQFHVAEDGRLGFRALREHTVIPIQVCYIMEPEVEALWKSLDLEFPELRGVVLRGDMGTDDRLALLRSTFDELPELEVDFPVSINLELGDGQVVNLIGAPWLTAHVARRDFRVSADAFFQVNTRMAEVLVRQVREGLRPRGGQTLLDLYAGVGLFGLALADEMGQVIAIEEHPGAVRDWEVNAQGLDNARLLPGKVEAVLPTLQERVDLVVLDPPRAGVEPAALDALAALRAPRIVYVSCDPATLARDAARLVQQGYRVRYVQPVDLFPQTWHIECVTLLELDAGQRTEARGRRSGDERRRTEERGRATEDGGRRTEGRGGRTDDRGRGTDDRGRGTGDGGRKREGGGPKGSGGRKTDDRGRKTGGKR